MGLLLLDLVRRGAASLALPGLQPILSQRRARTTRATLRPQLEASGAKKCARTWPLRRPPPRLRPTPPWPPRPLLHSWTPLRAAIRARSPGSSKRAGGRGGARGPSNCARLCRLRLGRCLAAAATRTRRGRSVVPGTKTFPWPDVSRHKI